MCLFCVSGVCFSARHWRSGDVVEAVGFYVYFAAGVLIPRRAEHPLVPFGERARFYMHRVALVLRVTGGAGRQQMRRFQVVNSFPVKLVLGVEIVSISVDIEQASRHCLVKIAI